MTRRVPTLEVGPLMEALVADPADDEVAASILDATLDLLSTRGLRPWSIDDVVERTGAGRTTIYRRFGDRDQLVAAALARECHRFFAEIAAGVTSPPSLTDEVVEGFLRGLRLARSSPFASLIEADPVTFIPFLTTNAERLVGASRDVLVALAVARYPERDGARTALVAEVLIRLALSLLITPSPLIDPDDEVSARRALAAIIGPLVEAD